MREVLGAGDVERADNLLALAPPETPKERETTGEEISSIVAEALSPGGRVR